MCKLIANWLINHMMITFQLMKNNKLWLTVHSLCVNVELCNRAVTSRVEGSDGDAAVPPLHHQERCHIRHVPYLRQLLLPLWLVAHLICKDTTSSPAGVTVLWKMGWKNLLNSLNSWSVSLPQQCALYTDNYILAIWDVAEKIHQTHFSPLCNKPQQVWMELQN